MAEDLRLAKFVAKELQIVSAAPMTLWEYHDFLGNTVPDDEDGTELGMVVSTEDCMYWKSMDEFKAMFELI